MILRSITISLSLWLLCVASLVACETKKIILIASVPDHRDGSHCYQPDCKILAECLRQTPGVEVEIITGWPKDKARLDSADVLVLNCRKGGNVMFHPKNRDHAVKLIEKGVGVCAIHFGTACSRVEAGPAFLDALGGHYSRDFAEYGVFDSTMRIANTSHPVSRGLKDFPMRDEYYYKLRFKENSVPIATANVKGTDYPIAWVYERPDSKGRSFGCVAGHYHDVYEIEDFRRILVNGILWVAQIDIPKGGAPCNVTKEDLQLPDGYRHKKSKSKSKDRTDK